MQFVEPKRQGLATPLFLVPTVPPHSMADAQPLSQDFPLLMLPGDFPMVLQSEDITQRLELGNLATLQQIYGKYGDNVVGNVMWEP
jgi:hypothetical protein